MFDMHAENGWWVFLFFALVFCPRRWSGGNLSALCAEKKVSARPKTITTVPWYVFCFFDPAKHDRRRSEKNVSLAAYTTGRQATTRAGESTSQCRRGRACGNAILATPSRICRRQRATNADDTRVDRKKQKKHR